MSSVTFLKIGNKYTKTKTAQSKLTSMRRFKSFFGVTPNVCAIIWKKIKKDAPTNSAPMHLLWCLNFLKQYSNEHTRRALLDVDEKTIRKWTWTFIELLSNLDVVQLAVLKEFHLTNRTNIF